MGIYDLSAAKTPGQALFAIMRTDERLFDKTALVLLGESTYTADAAGLLLVKVVLFCVRDYFAEEWGNFTSVMIVARMAGKGTAKKPRLLWTCFT